MVFELSELLLKGGFIHDGVDERGKMKERERERKRVFYGRSHDYFIIAG
jgi:hypothetical protein